MFNNRKDPLVDSVKAVMQENAIRRQVEAKLNEELGIASKKALPFEMHPEYDRVLEEAIKEALVGNQHKIDVNNNNRIDAHDFKLLKKGVRKEEANKGLGDMAVPGNVKPHSSPVAEEAPAGGVKGTRAPLEVGGQQKPGTPSLRLVKPVNEDDDKNHDMDDHDDDDKEYGVDTEREMAKKKYPKKAKDMEEEVNEESYSAKEARKGKDIGKPGKMFAKIAKSAGERYGSEERGKKVAGAILKKLRAKEMKEDTNLPLAEKTLTTAEKSEREHLVKKMKGGDWSKRYGERGKDVMYATATKMAKKLAEDVALEDILAEIRANLGEEAFAALMEAGTFAPGDNPENPNFGKGKTWGPVTGPQFDSGRTIPTAQVAQNMAQAGVDKAVVDAANKASIGPFLGRPDAPISPNKPNFQQDIAQIGRQLSPKPATTLAPAAPAAPKPAPDKATASQIMNDPDYKKEVERAGGEKAARRMAIGTRVGNLGVLGKGETIYSKVAAKINARNRMQGGA